MATLSAARKSTKIADVLQILQNPRTPESAKERTLRRLDGLEGRHAPIVKRLSMEHESRGREMEQSDLDATTNRNSSVGFHLDSNCRLAVTEGVRPLSPHQEASDSGPRFLSPSPPPRRAPSDGRRHVMFIDEWDLAGQEPAFILHDPSNRDGVRQNTQVASAA